jgi:hypothetical protein
MGKQALINQSNCPIALFEKVDCSHPSSLKPELILGNQNFWAKVKIGHENVMGHGAFDIGQHFSFNSGMDRIPVSVSLPEIVIKMNLFLHW